MAQLIDLQTVSDNRGKLTVIEKIIPFAIKRIFYIYEVDNSVRGGHRHKNSYQAAVCIKGQCRIHINNGHEISNIVLNELSKCLIINPQDWHVMDQFSPDSILMILVSTEYDPDDYIYTPYQ